MNGSPASSASQSHLAKDVLPHLRRKQMMQGVRQPQQRAGTGPGTPAAVTEWSSSSEEKSKTVRQMNPASAVYRSSPSHNRSPPGRTKMPPNGDNRRPNPPPRSASPSSRQPARRKIQRVPPSDKKALEFARAPSSSVSRRRSKPRKAAKPPPPPRPAGNSTNTPTTTVGDRNYRFPKQKPSRAPQATATRNIYRYTVGRSRRNFRNKMDHGAEGRRGEQSHGDVTDRMEDVAEETDSSGADDQGKPRAASDYLPPTIAPGSPVEQALKTPVQPPRKKLHRPATIKKKMMGTEQYYKEKAEKLQGKIINQQHTLYHLSYAMMVGIYSSVAGVPAETPLTMDDFMKVNKLEFPPNGSRYTEPHLLQETFKMKDYAPKVFHYLRERFGIDRQDYLASLGGAYQYIEFQSNSKSGQFFFFSHDGKFMIKTQTKAESRFLRRIMVHYFKHVVQNEGTYLPRFYGMHRLKMKHLKKKVHFVVMHSVFDAGDLPIHVMYDLKGSKHNRQASLEQKAKGLGKCVLKDNDLIESGKKLKLGPERRAAFLEQLRLDTDFLREMKIMDYSLLVGIRYRHQLHTPGVRRQSVVAVSQGQNRSACRPLPVGHAASTIEDGSSANPPMVTAQSHQSDGPNIAEEDRYTTEDLKYFPQSCTGVPSQTYDGNVGEEVYYLGLIDVLQQYNIRKTAESMMRSIINKRSEVSAVDPDFYAERFLQFIADNST